MEEQKVYEYNGFIVLKKRKKSGVLKISEGKIIFCQVVLCQDLVQNKIAEFYQENVNSKL